MKSPPHGHDIIAIGASSGGVEALRNLVPHLAADLQASVFVVLHIGVRSHLADILGKNSALPVVEAESGVTIERGKVYVAGPGTHLLLHDHHILLSRGPRENMSRPAIDPLFRSAAATFGGRVIGVVLTGALNDGTSGLRAIKRCGGIAVAQDPSNAAFSSMPRSALRHVAIDHVVGLAELPPLLDDLTRQPAGQTPEIPMDIRLETAIAAQDLSGMKTEDRLGEISPFTCPECSGALWEIHDGSMLRYRCHMGHAYTAEAALSAGDAEIDNMLERLLRSHRERAALARRMAQSERVHQRHGLADRLDARASEYDQNAELMLRLSRHRDRPDLIDDESAIEGTAAAEE